jgi:hypothetical protein
MSRSEDFNNELFHHVESLRNSVNTAWSVNAGAETAPVSLNDEHSLAGHLLTAHWHEPSWFAGSSLEELQQMHEEHHQENSDEFEARGGSVTIGDDHFHNRED